MILPQCFPLQLSLSLRAGLWAFLQLVSWEQSPLAGFHHPWQIDVISPTWWGFQFATWSRSTQRCHAHGLGGNVNTCSGAFCLDRPSACLAMLVLHRSLFVWGLDPAGYSRGWSLLSSLMGVLISYPPFIHLSELPSYFCLDKGYLASISSLANPPRLLSRL